MTRSLVLRAATSRCRAMMAMCRLNVPAIFIYGGSILPAPSREAGHHPGRVRAVGNVPSATCPTPISRRWNRMLSFGGRVRHAVHRQHNGDGIGSNRAGAALPRPVRLRQDPTPSA
jgi:hypothetical protein